MPLLYHELTEKIIAGCFEVSNTLGAGFIESVYQNALYLVLEEKGFKVNREYPLSVYFKEKVIGQFYADLLVEEKVIVELKAVDNLNPIFEAQLLSYLRMTDKKIGLLINFNVPILKQGIKRMIL